MMRPNKLLGLNPNPKLKHYPNPKPCHSLFLYRNCYGATTTNRGRLKAKLAQHSFCLKRQNRHYETSNQK